MKIEYKNFRKYKLIQILGGLIECDLYINGKKITSCHYMPLKLENPPKRVLNEINKLFPDKNSVEIYERYLGYPSYEDILPYDLREKIFDKLLEIYNEKPQRKWFLPPEEDVYSMLYESIKNIDEETSLEDYLESEQFADEEDYTNDMKIYKNLKRAGALEEIYKKFENY